MSGSNFFTSPIFRSPLSLLISSLLCGLGINLISRYFSSFFSPAPKIDNKDQEPRAAATTTDAALPGPSESKLKADEEKEKKEKEKKEKKEKKIREEEEWNAKLKKLDEEIDRRRKEENVKFNMMKNEKLREIESLAKAEKSKIDSEIAQLKRQQQQLEQQMEQKKSSASQDISLELNRVQDSLKKDYEQKIRELKKQHDEQIESERRKLEQQQMSFEKKDRNRASEIEAEKKRFESERRQIESKTEAEIQRLKSEHEGKLKVEKERLAKLERELQLSLEKEKNLKQEQANISAETQREKERVLKQEQERLSLEKEAQRKQEEEDRKSRFAKRAASFSVPQSAPNAAEVPRVPSPNPPSSNSNSLTLPVPNVARDRSNSVGAHQPTIKVDRPLCAGCSQPLAGSVVEANSKEFHAHCFKCEGCASLLSTRFVTMKNKILCSECAYKERKSGSHIGGSTPHSRNAPLNRSTSVPQSAFNQTVSPRLPSSTSFGGAKQSGMMGLFQWAQNRTAEYRGVELKNWTKSWADGMAFCALMHSYFPESIDYDSLSPDNAKANIHLAFQVAEKAGISQLLDEEDFALEKLSMMTYFSEVYKTLNV